MPCGRRMRQRPNMPFRTDILDGNQKMLEFIAVSQETLTE